MKSRIIVPPSPKLITRRSAIRTIPAIVVVPAIFGSAACDEEFLNILLKIAKAAFSIYEEINGNGEVEYGGDGGQTFRLIADLFEGSSSGDSELVTSVEQELTLDEGTNQVTFGKLKPVNTGVHFVRGSIGRNEANTEDFQVEM